MTRPLPKCGQASRDRGGRPGPSPAAVAGEVSAALKPQDRSPGWLGEAGGGGDEFPARHPRASVSPPGRADLGRGGGGWEG